MVNNRRSRLDIIKDIIKISKDGAKKTEILYRNNMSYTQLNSYLDLLKEKDIIKVCKNQDNGNSKGIIYVNTKKGMELLKDMERILAVFK